MAKLKRLPGFVTRLTSALETGLRELGLSATIRCEPVGTTELYRFTVLASKFNQFQHSERQGLVWRIAEQALDPKEQLRASMILTLTPQEARETPSRVRSKTL